MFKNNSYSAENCNYSFREEDTDKENQHGLANYIKKDNIMTKLESIEKMLSRQYEIELENRRLLSQQAESILKIEKQISKLNKAAGIEDNKNSRLKSESMKSCRTKRSTEKTVLHCIEERKKIINEQLSRRINDQLQNRIEKKPLRFFLPSQQTLT